MTGNEEAVATGRQAWWVGALVLVPLIYLLTIPPLVFVSIRHASRSGAPRIPEWIGVYAAPYDWAMDHTPLAGALEAYGAWWDSIISDKPTP